MSMPIAGAGVAAASPRSLSGAGASGRTPGHDQNQPPRLHPPAACCWAQGVAGTFADPTLEAWFWRAQAPLLASQDTLVLAVIALLLAVGGNAQEPAAPPPLPLLAASATAACASMFSMLARPTHARWRLAVAAVVRVACVAAAVVYMRQWPRPAVAAVARGGLRASWASFLTKSPVVMCLLVPAIGLAAPPGMHAAVGALCVALALADVGRSAWMRDAYFGADMNAAAASALSRATRAVLRPWEAAPRAVAPRRATALLEAAFHTNFGFVLPTQVMLEVQRAARGHVAAIHAPPGAWPPPGRPWLSCAARCAAVQACAWLGLWWLLEEHDGWDTLADELGRAVAAQGDGGGV